MRKCPECKKYTFKLVCEHCNIRTMDPRPSKFSPLDKYGEYRRRLLKSVD